MGRDERMCSMFIGGSTYQEIGNAYGISRQRVAQILNKVGITGKDGGVSRRSNERKRLKREAIETRFMSFYGCTRGRWRHYRAFHEDIEKTPLYPFKKQKGNAKERNIEWLFNIDEWWEVWNSSGKWEKRGRCLGQYVMARYGDVGPYSKDNVYITTCSENSSYGRALCEARKRAK